MISAADVEEIHRLLTANGIEYWIGGGWGIDALLRRQTRKHDDLDISIRSEALPAVLNLLEGLGFESRTDWLPTRIAVRDAADREIDVHPLVFESDGSAWLPGMDKARYVYPADAFASGQVGSTRVPCISAALQAEFHRGYELQAKDIADMKELRAAGLLDEATDAPD